MKPITPKQKRVLEFIESHIRSEGYPPSQWEIAYEFGFSSLGTVQNYLLRLERAGYLSRSWNAKRGISLTKSEPGHYELPLAGTVAAGKPIDAIETADTIEVPSSMAGSGENFVLKVTGDSMIEDGILDGDYVVVRKQHTAQNGQTVVALIDNEATIKRFIQREDAVELAAANPAVPSIFIDGNQDLRIEGIVVGVIRHCK